MTFILLGLLILSALARRKLTLSIFDQLNMVYIKECIMIYTIIIGINDYIPQNFFPFIAFSYLSWILLLYLIGRFFSETYYTAVNKMCSWLESGSTSLRIVMIIFGLVLVIFLMVGLVTGGGDARLLLAKELRVIEPIYLFAQQLAIYALLYKFLILKKRWYIILILSMLIPLFYVGGKSTIMIVLYAVNYLVFRNFMKVSIFSIFVLIITVVTGISVSIFINYDINSVIGALELLMFRMQMDSDIYFLYFQQGFGSSVNLTSGVAYLFGPIFKLLGLGYMVEMNIGAQLSSLVLGKQVITGPNAHLPFVLYSLSSIESVVFSGAIYFFLTAIFMIYIFKGTGKDFISATFIALSVTVLNRYNFDPPALTLLIVELVLFSVLLRVIRTLVYKPK
jgi:hypothetical protein